MVFSTLVLRKRILQIGAIIRTTSFDTSTAEGRSQERFRRAFWTSLATLAAKGITLITVLISVPLTVGYLGTERYGMWMTISATIAALAFADLGMGTGLMNAISAASGSDDGRRARVAVSSSFFVMMGMGFVVAAAFFAVYPLVPWPKLFNVKSALAIAEAGPAVAAFAACFVLNIPLGVVQRVQMGFQEGFETSMWQSAGNVIGLVAVVAAIQMKAGLPYLVLGMSGGPVVAWIVGGIVQFGVKRPWLRPRWNDVDWKVGRGLIAAGLCFTFLNIMNLLGTQSDNLVIAHYLGASAVATYAVAVKLYGMTSIFQLLLSPFWPAFGEAMARGDYAWASRTLRRLSTASVGIAVLLGLPLVFLGRPIIALWVGPALMPSALLLLSLAIWSVAGTYLAAMAMFLNNDYTLRKQMWFFAAASLAALLLKLPFVQLWRESGAVLATIVAYSLLYNCPAKLLAARTLTNLQRKQQAAASEVPVQA